MSVIASVSLMVIIGTNLGAPVRKGPEGTVPLSYVIRVSNLYLLLSQIFPISLMARHNQRTSASKGQGYDNTFLWKYRMYVCGGSFFPLLNPFPRSCR